MLCRHLDQTAAVSPERANRTNEARRTEAGSQQPHRMKVLKPLAVGHVGLPAGNILYVLRVDETHLQRARLQDLMHGNPVHAGCDSIATERIRHCWSQSASAFRSRVKVGKLRTG